MRVRKLRKMLKKCNQDAKVLISDADGNYYSFLDMIQTGLAINEDEPGEVGIPELTEELEDAGFSEGDVVDGDDCIILTP